MGQRFTITEEERNNISKMYGFVNEQQESNIVWNSLKSSMPLSAEQQRELVIYLKGILKKTPSGCYNVPEGFAYNSIDTISHALNHEGSETCTFCRLPHSEDSKWTHLRIRNACFNVGRNRVFDDPSKDMESQSVTTVDMEDSPIFPPQGNISEQVKSDGEIDPKIAACAMKVLDLKDYTKIPTCLKLAAKVMLFKKMPEFKDMQDGLKCAGELASIDQAPEKALEFFKCVYENVKEDIGNPMDMVKHLDEEFTGIKNGNIQYTTKGGKNLEYKVTHPMSDFEVIEFNMKDGKFKLKGNFLAGEQVGVIHPNILSQIETNMEQSKPSFDVVTKKEGQKVTFKLV